MFSQSSILHPVAIAQVMINFAASHGVSRAVCLQGTGIRPELLAEAEALISRQQEMRLIENLIQALPDVAALGFRLGLEYSLATFGVWGFALRTSRTLRDAVVSALRYLPLSTAYCHMRVISDGENFGVAFDTGDIPHHLRPFLLERDLATGMNLLKELSLSGTGILAVEFERAPPPYEQELASLLGVEPTYQQGRNAMLVSPDVADRPLPTYNASLVRLLEDQCRQQLKQRQPGGIASLVRQQLLGKLGLVASLDDIAGSLAMSPRNLRRKLEQEGTSFRGLVEEERRQAALAMLSGSEMKLEELAIYLGYTDTASFTRAFRRWVGVSPGEYRKNPESITRA